MRQPPPITDRMGKMWDQPPLHDIWFMEDLVVMTSKTLKELAEYSHSIPSGKYVGKMWRSLCADGTWVLRWYDADENPEYLSIPLRRIAVIDLS